MRAIKLNFKKFGEGRPLIILHGLFGSLDNWQTIGNELQKDYQVYLVDLRNHGKSEHTSEMNYLLMALDILTLIHTENLKSVGLIGHSMGGKVILELLKTNPNNIWKAMVVDIGPKAYKGGHEEIFQAMKNLKLSEINKRSEAEEQLSSFILSPSVRQFILKNIERTSDNKFIWKLNLEALFYNYDSIGAEINYSNKPSTDIQFLIGEKSLYVSESDKINIKQIFPYASFQIILNAGHWVHADQPLNTINAIRNFFK